MTTDVSVIIPCRNERSTIEQVLADLHAQTFAGTMEVIVADGCSDDGTRDILDAASASEKFRYPLRVITNGKRVIPSALNKAVESADGRVIIRVDGHSHVPCTYVEEIVQALAQGTAEVVGPRVRFVPGSTSSVAYAISTVQSSVFGTGGTASRRNLSKPVRVVHAVMSCYNRTVWERVGGYDESLLTNEDFDFDYRATQAGATVLALPSPEFQLMARSTLRGLLAQRWRYGWWKAAVIKKHPGSLHLRQIIPVVALVSFVALGGASFASSSYAVALVATIYGYAGLSSCAALLALMPNVLTEESPDGKKILATVLLAPFIFAIIHGIWAAGVVSGLLFGRIQRR
ncbi:MAG: glycosyltransferase family 2 protein [Candidatus Kapabacteria bacterium]|nr:glycosyltransferase family 2 protein [Candidatus Kapabacteria bacterium]